MDVKLQYRAIRHWPSHDASIEELHLKDGLMMPKASWINVRKRVKIDALYLRPFRQGQFIFSDEAWRKILSLSACTTEAFECTCRPSAPAPTDMLPVRRITSHIDTGRAQAAVPIEVPIPLPAVYNMNAARPYQPVPAHRLYHIVRRSQALSKLRDPDIWHMNDQPGPPSDVPSTAGRRLWIALFCGLGIYLCRSSVRRTLSHILGLGKLEIIGNMISAIDSNKGCWSDAARHAAGLTMTYASSRLEHLAPLLQAIEASATSASHMITVVWDSRWETASTLWTNMATAIQLQIAEMQSK